METEGEKIMHFLKENINNIRETDFCYEQVVVCLWARYFLHGRAELGLDPTYVNSSTPRHDASRKTGKGQQYVCMGSVQKRYHVKELTICMMNLPFSFISLSLSLFQVIDVLSKLAGLWVNAKKEIMYSQASQITFICPMIFNYFPLDTQVGRYRLLRSRTSTYSTYAILRTFWVVNWMKIFVYPMSHQTSYQS